MELINIFSKLNEEWNKIKNQLSNEELLILERKNTLRNKLTGFLSMSYYQRRKMILSSYLFFGYVFKLYKNDISNANEPTRVWCLFSPSKTVNDVPYLLKEAKEKIFNSFDNKKLTKKEKELKKICQKNLSNASFYLLDKSLTNNEVVYLSIIDGYSNLNPVINLGFNLIISSPSVSKEIILLPLKYYNNDLATEYEKGKLII